MKFLIYRYNENATEPSLKEYDLDIEEKRCIMLLDALEALKEIDPTIAFRRSCGEGVCGSDAMNVNGKNRLACITPLHELSDPVTIRPLPSFPVIRDLVVDMKQFYQNYEKVQPYLQSDANTPAGEYIQSPEERQKIDGLYECILCACCTSSCPSSWWNPDKFVGPAGLLQAARFINDSRDTKTTERLEQLNDAYSVFRCHTIMNCVDVCPKGLNPTAAIASIKDKMIDKS
ncbi:MAG: succinate dehydrogenase iron-sulfur subunit [Gammaproteobacteria bacterium]|nr:succinate dehydrogenase iron-sulfur subunit [Gammaproteobacteria bacterium]